MERPCLDTRVICCSLLRYHGSIQLKEECYYVGVGSASEEEIKVIAIIDALDWLEWRRIRCRIKDLECGRCCAVPVSCIVGHAAVEAAMLVTRCLVRSGAGLYLIT